MGIQFHGCHKLDVVILQRLEAFFVALGIENVKYQTLEKLYEAGYTTLKQIFDLSIPKLAKIEGIQTTLATKLYNNIHTRLKEGVELPLLMKASGQFGRSIGERKSKMVLDTYPDILSIAPNQWAQKLKTVKGFQNTTASQFIEGLPKFIKWYKVYKPYIPIAKPKKIKQTGSRLNNQVIQFTGFRDADLEKTIQANGGKIASSMTGVTVLLVKSKASTSIKITTAKSKGIKIMTPEEFKSKFKV